MIPRPDALRRSGALLVLTLALAAGPSGFAAPEKDGASSVVARAVQAYKAKHYQEAAELFLEAYQRSGVPNQIRNAAKAYQDGALYDEAEHSWRRFREHHGVSPAEIAEADAQIAFINERKKAAEATRQAEEARAAQEQAEAGRAKEAEDARQANARADQAERAQAAVPPPPPVVEPPPPPPPAIVAPAPEPESAPAIAAWVTAGVGAAAAITGGVLLIHAGGRLSTLDEQLAIKDGGGRIVGTSPGAAQSELDGINSERWIGGISLSVGAGAALFGVLWGVLSAD